MYLIHLQVSVGENLHRIMKFGRRHGSSHNSLSNFVFCLFRVVADRIYVNKDIFYQWEYGPALIFDALFDSDVIFHMNYSVIIDSYLDKWLQDPKQFGYKVSD